MTHAGAMELARIAAELNEEEGEVLLLVARGLAVGRRAYGPMDLAGDRRDFLEEALQEHRDALVYLAAETLHLRRLRDRDDRQLTLPGVA